MISFAPGEHLHVEINKVIGDDETVVSCLYFGVARQTEESAWDNDCNIFQIDYNISDSDVYISSITK